MPPAVTFPVIAEGTVLPNMRAFRGFYPNHEELAALPGALTDLASFVDYTSLLGSSAPLPTALIGVVNVGLAWRTQRNASQAWTAFVAAQDGIAWKAASSMIDELRPLFLFAVAKNPELATAYPGLTQLFHAGKAAAELAAATKRKAVKAQAAAAKKAAVDEAAAELAEAKAAAASAAANATGKGVTVNNA
jgi:hypothetical protein